MRSRGGPRRGRIRDQRRQGAVMSTEKMTIKSDLAVVNALADDVMSAIDDNHIANVLHALIVASGSILAQVPGQSVDWFCERLREHVASAIQQERDESGSVLQ